VATDLLLAVVNFLQRYDATPYHILQRHEPHKDLGSNYFDERERRLSRDSPSADSNAWAFR